MRDSVFVMSDFPVLRVERELNQKKGIFGMGTSKGSSASSLGNFIPQSDQKLFGTQPVEAVFAKALLLAPPKGLGVGLAPKRGPEKVSGEPWTEHKFF